jgi:hypothetical protein
MDKSALYDALSALGPWFGAGGLTAIIVAYIGTRKPSSEKPDDEPASARWFFDGPVQRALDTLEGTYREIRELRKEFGESERDTRERHKEHMEVMRDLTDRLPRRR